MTNIITFNQLIRIFNDFADTHQQLNDFGYGSPFELEGQSRPMKFPYLWISHSGSSSIQVINKTQTPTIQLTFIILDQLNNQTYKGPQIPNGPTQIDNGQNSINGQEIISDTFQIAQDLVNYIQTQLGEFGIVFGSETINVTPVFDQTPNKCNGVMVDTLLKLRHSNCLSPMGDVTFTVPGQVNTSFRYLTCDSLANCSTFNLAIDGLQEQIDNLPPSANDYTIDAYLTGNILHFDRTDLSDAYQVDLSSLSTEDKYTTAAYLIGNVIHFDRVDLADAYNVDLSSILGGDQSLSDVLTVSNTTSGQDLIVSIGDFIQLLGASPSQYVKTDVSNNLVTVATIPASDITYTTDKNFVTDAELVTVQNAVTLTGTETLTNKRISKRIVTVVSASQPILNTDNCDIARLTGLGINVNTFSTNLTGTPNHGDLFCYEITDNGTQRTLLWGSMFTASGILSLPTVTTINTLLKVLFQWNSVTNTWVIVGWV